MGWMALLDTKTGTEIGVVGDSVWDVMDDAIGKIKQAYKDEWHREPTTDELISIFEFCTEISVST